MDFTFGPEQEALRDAVRSFLDREGSHDLVRRAVEDGGRVPERLWPQLVELGWAGLLVPEELGGAGLGLVDLVVVQEELGRRAFAGPFLSSSVQATLAARRLDEPKLLRALAYGSARGTLALEELGDAGDAASGGDPLAGV